MLEQLRADLERVRADRDAWAEVAYARGEDEEGRAIDRHELARARVLWALQYERRPEDLPLLRFLLEQEATCRREAPDQGMGEELEMAGYFVAGHRQVEDVWSRMMQYELADLGDFGAAAAVQEQLVPLIDDPFTKASALVKLAELRRLAGEPAGAWQALSACERVLQGVDEWRGVGLGRHFVQEHFQLVVVMPDDEAARTVLAAGHRHAAAVPRLPFVALEAAVEAAERLGDTDLRDSYRILRDEERRRIDAELDQLRH